MAIQQQIIDGPSKFDLMISLLHGNSKEAHRVTFHGEADALWQAVINSLEREDGSFERWIINGYLHHGRTFKAFYRTNTRKGWIEVGDHISKK